MDLIGDERGRLARVASWLDASPAEALGLAVLLTGACVATALFVWTALGRPALPEVPVSDAAANAGQDAQDAAEAQVPSTEAHGTVGTGAAADGTASRHDHDGGTGVGPDPADAGPVGEVTVHVAGAVNQPGLVTLTAGARVADAVAASGGLTPEADLARTNLARPLTDGEHVLVLREGEEAPPRAAGAVVGAYGGAGSGGGRAGPLDLNTATVEQLQTLPGIGPTLAERIVRHREQLGRFAAPGDLRDVSGIGEVRFQEIAPLVTVG